MELIITNPAGALQNVTDFRTQKTVEGELLRDSSETFAFGRANATITKGQAVMLVAATATVPLSYTPMTVAGDPRLFAGIAEHAAVAGAYVRVCRQGICDVFVNAQTVAFGDVVKVPGTNTGESTCSATDPDATTIAGTIIGVVLAAKDATSLLAPCKLAYA